MGNHVHFVGYLIYLRNTYSPTYLPNGTGTQDRRPSLFTKFCRSMYVVYMYTYIPRSRISTVIFAEKSHKSPAKISARRAVSVLDQPLHVMVIMGYSCIHPAKPYMHTRWAIDFSIDVDL